ncbi:hypothetical protein IMCC3317_46660 [Kordia antarctica]|uniref:EF-hand domain-containing protein n=1 Tax=Kordia antarctica TaxID=1218801 RepID=A0A7L4ZRY0_9FLAO|nr:EF-hand domain-containing protein [Kordia antarctica]QHI39261.1 hypothetical protein IMCC3317_46660 [Kordia antarctica]
MKYLKITLAVVALFAFSQTYAQDIGPKLKKKFAKIDTNSDNSVSLEELTAFYEGKKTKKGHPFKADKILLKKDTNKDGKLSLEEFAAKWDKKAKAKGKGKGKKKN